MMKFIKGLFTKKEVDHIEGLELELASLHDVLENTLVEISEVKESYDSKKQILDIALSKLDELGVSREEIENESRLMTMANELSPEDYAMELALEAYEDERVSH